MKTTLPNYGPVALVLNHSDGQIRLSESCAREWLAYMRAYIDETPDDQPSIFQLRAPDSWLQTAPMLPDRARQFADEIETALLRFAAKGRAIGKIDHITRDERNEITKMETRYQY